MKKPKIVKPFYFKDKTHQEMVDLLNSELPINLKYNEELVNRIHAKYPLIDKSQVAYIVRAVFQSFRDLLVLQKVLNFNNLFFDAKLLIFAHHRKGVIFPAIKIEMTTPPRLRKK
jgi:hypothetical protein